MSVKIRLARRGRRKKPYYHIVVADARAPRDGRFIEQIGAYNPMTSPATIEIDFDKAYEWLENGAQPTNTARAILRFKGVMYKRHLQRGVAKGALTQEQADQKLKEWIAEKDAKVAVRVEQAKTEKEARRKMISGEVKAGKKSTADKESKEAFREDTEKPIASAEKPAPEATETGTSPAKENIPAVPEVTKEAPAEVKEEVAAEAKEEVVAEVKEEAVAEVKEEVVAEVKEEVVAEVKEEAPAEVKEDVVAEVKEEAVVSEEVQEIVEESETKNEVKEEE